MGRSNTKPDVREGYFYTLSSNTVTGERDHARQVYEVLGVNETHAIVRGVMRVRVPVVSMFGPVEWRDAGDPQTIVLVIDEFAWSPCDASMLAGLIEGGVSTKCWFKMEPVS